MCEDRILGEVTSIFGEDRPQYVTSPPRNELFVSHFISRLVSPGWPGRDELIPSSECEM